LVVRSALLFLWSSISPHVRCSSSLNDFHFSSFAFSQVVFVWLWLVIVTLSYYIV
jgi:hypothetical protein